LAAALGKVIPEAADEVSALTAQFVAHAQMCRTVSA
jgi:hypothetical protein